MDIVSIGAGPAGLYFAILMRKAFPASRIRVLERNKPDDTFGWGVVFSEETLSTFGEADRESYDAIRASFAYWDDIETHFGGTRVTSTGHGFCGMSRRRLLEILQQRCRALGVELEFQREVKSAEEFRHHADVVIAADGVNSAVRAEYASAFLPQVGWGRAKFTWLGTTKPLRAFTFVFKENKHGLFQVHAYPFETKDGRCLSTWIVECREETWKAAGLDHATEEDTVRYCEELFAEDLGGHRLLTNKSLWRSFPTVRCATWRHENVVLVGDAAHTAHFSIGSGTKLAMEDAIALRDAFVAHGSEGVPAVLAAYEEARRLDVLKLQRAADVSREWFENSGRYVRQHPLQFSFNLMTRSRRITYDNLAKRDPKLVADVTEWFRAETDTSMASDGSAPPPMFTPFKLRGMELANRVVVSPMCQYSATDGVAGDWHLVHLGSRAVGGAGLVVTEMTNVSADARITLGCAGMYAREHVAAWKRIVAFVHTNSASKIGIQIAHAGRKASAFHPWDRGFDRPLTPEEGAWESIAPSPLPFAPGWPVPREMTRADMDRVRDDFVRATTWSEEAGFDLVEVHMAHGYLLSTFISPLTNRRTDDYGGSLENRMRWPLEVFRAMRAVWPHTKPMSVRITATDWVEDGGLTGDDAVEVARLLHAVGCDVIDVSTSGNTIESRPQFGRMFQVPFADRIRHEVGIPVMAVGMIQGADHVNTVIAAGRADLCALARPHLYDPYLTLHAAADAGFPDVAWPEQYLAAKPPKKA